MNALIWRTAWGIVRLIFPVTKKPNDKSGQAIESAELLCYINKRVVRAEIWECLLEKVGGIRQSLGILHQGIVVTMESGGMLLVHKLPGEEEGKGDMVVTYKSNMGENWSHVRSKDVPSAKLSDYLDRCGHGFNIITDSSLHAVARMWSLN